MRSLNSLFFLSFFLLAGVSLTAQSLIEDAHRLVEARRQLTELPARMDPEKRAQFQAAAYAEMMAILQQYENTYGAGALNGADLFDLPERYADNQLLADFLPLQALAGLEEGFDTLFIDAYAQKCKMLELAPRQKMVDLMLGQYGTSPAEYLSVSKALQSYRIPPIESKRALNTVAQESNRNIQNNLVNSQALLEGLFQFVLKRAQQEVAINFMDRFLEKEVPTVQELFPTVFEEVNSTGFSYSHSYLDRVRAAFYEDMQLLSVRLPGILMEEERFESLQTDPILYNLLAVYSIIGMAQNELPLEEIMAITHHNIYENFQQNQKQLNFQLADQSPEIENYSEIVGTSSNILELLEVIYAQLNDAENALEDQLLDLEERQRDEIADSLRQPTPDFDFMFESAYSLGAIMGDSEDSDQAYRLNFLPYLLQGTLDSTYLLGLRTVASYDRYFAEEQTEREWQAAGMELARNLNGTWYNRLSLDELLERWVEDLLLYRQALGTWERSLFPGDAQQAAFVQVEENRKLLQETIQSTKQYWKGDLSRQQRYAFDVLAAIISDPFKFEGIQVEIELRALGKTKEDLLNERQIMLLEVEERLENLQLDLVGDEPLEKDNPLALYRRSQQSSHPYAGVLINIETLRTQLLKLRHLLETTDERYAPTEHLLLENAKPMLFLSESLTHLLYCLRSSDPDQKWITRTELDSVLNAPELREAFLGLLYQRMRQIKQTENISPEGLAQLVQLTVNDLPMLLPPPDSVQVEPDSLAFYHKSAFLVNTFNRILELPLFVDQEDSEVLLSLSEQEPKLAPVPEISQQVLDLIYFLNIKDHRHAISTTLKLFLEVEPLVKGDKTGSKELEDILTFLNEYGYFVAGLIDAETAEEIESLLNGIADPPGSSRLKRKKKTTVALNSYLGVSYGQETWNQASTQTEETFGSLAPTLPLGVSISRLLGRERIKVFDDPERPPEVRHGSSVTLFVSLIDLGSMFTYRFDDTNLGDPELTLKNVFKPGVQLHYNLPKSPFYFGVGAQYGPHFRDDNGNQITVQSTRFFFNFGVDVPVKTFFVK
jgi:hypothetical protein